MRVNNVLLEKARRSGFLTKVEVVSRQVTTQADYQIQVEDIISRKGDGEDIQFFQKNEILNHWLESYASGESDAWGKLSKLPATKSQLLNILSGNPSVSNGDDTFELFDDFIGGILEKTDLDDFTKIGLYEGSNPIIACGGASDSDKYIREPGNILYEPGEASRKYKIFYTGYNAGSSTDEKIHYAYSEDGKSWNKFSSNPVISTRQEDPYVVKNGSTYYMYSEDKATQGSDGHVRRWHSSDCESWTDDGVISLTDYPDDCASPIVWIEDTTWYMLYERWPTSPHTINLATSSDGLNWTDSGDNPVFTPTGNDIPDDVIKQNGTYYLFYHGSYDANFKAAMATSTDLVNWIDKSSINPIPSDESGFAYISSIQVFNDNENVFIYDPVGESNGIYRGYPIKVTSNVVDSSKWTEHKQGSNDAVIELDNNRLHLAGKPNTVSSANIRSKTNFTDNIIIEYKRKGTDDNYFHLSIGSGDIVDADGGTSDWWFTGTQSGYWLATSTVNSHSMYEMPAAGGKSTLGVDTTSIPETSYIKHKFVISNEASNNLRWYYDDTLLLQATDNTFLTNNKKILITQGEYSDGRGGDQYVDWIIVRKYATPEPLLIKRKINGKAGIIKSVCGGIAG